MIRSKFYENHTIINKKNFNSVLANKIYSKFYSNNLNRCEINKNICDENFIKLLTLFKNEVEKNNSTFHIILYPNKKHAKEFEKLTKKYDVNFDYYILNNELEVNFSDKFNKYQFKNDKHWNEYGNILFAQNLEKIFNKIGIETKNINYKDIYSQVEVFYNNNSDKN